MPRDLKAIGTTRKPPVRREKEVLAAILAYLPLIPGVVAWRTNSGSAMLRSGKSGPMVPVRFGFKGISDIIGWADFCRYPLRFNWTVAGPHPIPCTETNMYHCARFLAIEVKRPGEKPTREQAVFLDRVRKAGGLAIVATSVDDVRAALQPDK